MGSVNRPNWVQSHASYEWKSWDWFNLLSANIQAGAVFRTAVTLNIEARLSPKAHLEYWTKIKAHLTALCKKYKAGCMWVREATTEGTGNLHYHLALSCELSPDDLAPIYNLGQPVHLHLEPITDAVGWFGYMLKHKTRSKRTLFKPNLLGKRAGARWDKLGIVNPQCFWIVPRAELQKIVDAKKSSAIEQREIKDVTETEARHDDRERIERAGKSQWFGTDWKLVRAIANQQRRQQGQAAIPYRKMPMPPPDRNPKQRIATPERIATWKAATAIYLQSP